MKDADILEEAIKRLKLCIEGDRENREEALDDLKNLAGDQWPAAIKAERANRPCLTINRLPQFLRQVTGDLRNTNPAINILPADDKTPKDGAELVEGIVRGIQYRSDASSVYEGAAESAAACGMGYFRVLTEYADDDTFDQDILIAAIPNPFSVYFDPTARKSTREDARYGFITETMSKEDFEAAHPKKKAADVDFDGQTDGLEYWRSGDDVIVAEYFWKEPHKKTIAQDESGAIIPDPVEGAPYAQKRTVTYDKVMWAKMSGAEILEGPQQFPGKHIPIVAIMGEELYIGDRVYRSSVIRFGKDPQRMYNFFRSAHTEIVALQPKSPFVGTAKQFTGFERFWEQANTSNRAYLPYQADEKAPGAPKREAPPMASTGFIQEVALAADDLKATTGIYDAGLGSKSTETSGVAIRQRQMESDVSTSIYSDNMAKAVAHCGRIIVGMIPEIYDTARVMRILGKDDSQDMVPVNTPMMIDGGQVLMNDLTSGKYDVRVSVGPNYTTRRQETAESMMQFLQAFPGVAPVVGDLVAENMDWPGADQFAERLRATMPPGIIKQDKMPPEQQQAMAQQRESEAMMAQKQEAADQIKFREESAKADKAEADAARARFEAMKAEVELAMMQSGAVPAQQGLPI